VQDGHLPIKPISIQSIDDDSPVTTQEAQMAAWDDEGVQDLNQMALGKRDAGTVKYDAAYLRHVILEVIAA
jgi:hypothetical protein